MKILVLGGTGFIGRNIRETLGSEYRIIAPARSELDIYDGVMAEKFLRSEYFDAVINATDFRPPRGQTHDAKIMAASRLRGFFNLARCKDLYGKMIFFGSGAEYGRELPICSISEDEFDRVMPEDEYGFCLNTMTKYAETTSNIINLRLFGIFGKYEEWKTRFISNAICKALHGYPITLRQDTFFDYLDVSDLVKMVKCVMRNRVKHNHYNAVSGRRYSLLELARLVRETTQADVPIFVAKEGMGKEYTASNARISDEMGGFKPRRMEESIQELYQYYKDNLGVIDRYHLLYQ